MSNSDSTVHIQYVCAAYQTASCHEYVVRIDAANQPDAGHDAASGAIHAPPGLQQLDPKTAASLEAPLCTLMH